MKYFKQAIPLKQYPHYVKLEACILLWLIQEQLKVITCFWKVEFLSNLIQINFFIRLL